MVPWLALQWTQRSSEHAAWPSPMLGASASPFRNPAKSRRLLLWAVKSETPEAKFVLTHMGGSACFSVSGGGSSSGSWLGHEDSTAQ